MKVDQIPSTWQMQNIFKDLTRTEGRQISKLVFTDQSNEPQTEHRAGCEILWWGMEMAGMFRQEGRPWTRVLKPEQEFSG